MKKFAVIASLDLETSDSVIDISSKIAPIIDGIKIGVPALIESGKEILLRVREILGDKPLLVDLKIADIGFKSSSSWNGTNAKILAGLNQSGATHVTVHGFPGPSSIAEAVHVGNDYGIKVLLLPMMSHVGADTFFSRPVEISRFRADCASCGIEIVSDDDGEFRDITEGILLLGEAIGVAGYIGPATRPEDLKRYRSITEKPIWCPGFGRQDRLGRSLAVQLADWAAIVGPNSAAIVGSSIYAARDPEAAAQQIIELRDSVFLKFNSSSDDSIDFASVARSFTF
jgi:orotidine-5'-phosphate decarboxylase